MLGSCTLDSALPEELVDLILKALGGDPRSLRAACLVNSTFCRVAQSILFSRVRLLHAAAVTAEDEFPTWTTGTHVNKGFQHQCSAFLDLMLVASARQLQHHVRELHLGFYALLDPRTPLVLSHLTRLHTLVLNGSYPDNALASLDFADLEVGHRLHLLLSVLKSRTLPNLRNLAITYIQSLPEKTLDSCTNLHALELGMCSFTSASFVPASFAVTEGQTGQYPLSSLTLPVLAAGNCITKTLVGWKERCNIDLNELRLTNMAMVTAEKLRSISHLLDGTKTAIRRLHFSFILSITPMDDWIALFNHPGLAHLECLSMSLSSIPVARAFARALLQSKHSALSTIEIQLLLDAHNVHVGVLADASTLHEWAELDSALSGETLAPLPSRSVSIELRALPLFLPHTNIHLEKQIASLTEALPQCVKRGLLTIHTSFA